MSKSTIIIIGNNPIDTETRADAMQTMNTLSTLVLKRLQQLAKSPKAVAYLENSVKFEIIKKIIGA